MTVEEKERLLDLLSSSHDALRDVSEGVDPEMGVYTDPVWRVRDIIYHIAVWDRQVTKSIRTYMEGKEYAIPNLDEDDFNWRTVLEGRALTTQQVFSDWERDRDEFKQAVKDMPLDYFPGDLLYPWGDERGSVAQLVEYMSEHDVEHRDEILNAIKALKREDQV